MPALAPVYFNKALLNFRLFHELRIQGKSPPLPRPLGGPAKDCIYQFSILFQGRRKLFLVGGGGAEIEVWSPSRALQVRDFIGEIV